MSKSDVQFETLQSFSVEVKGQEVIVYPEVRCTETWIEFNEAQVREAFVAQGFIVTEEALQHNFNAWVDDQKSGYADSEHDVYLFSGCGANRLFFLADCLSNDATRETYAC